MTQPYTFKESVAALEPMVESRPDGLRELSKRLRWEHGWQGAGPLSYQSLARTVGGNSLRQTLHATDSDNPPTSLRQAYERLEFPLGGGVTLLPDEPISLRRIAARIKGNDVVRLRFLTYNTYLLQGLQLPLDGWIDDALGWDALSWFGIPFGGELLAILGLNSIPGLALAEILQFFDFTPSKVITQITGIDLNGIQFSPKPALEARGSELGQVLSKYDICCLCEVWTQDSRDRIHHSLDALGSFGWEQATGPDESGSWILAGSGLLFLARNRHIVKSERMIYAHRGERRHDSDAWSNKGAMLNVIDLGFGQIEVFQTHLYYGDGLPEIRIPGVDIPLLSEPSPEERSQVWRDELTELAAFYRQHHQPQNVAIITGDFNMSGANVREYGGVRRMMDNLNMGDLWAWDVYNHRPSKGFTCRFTDGDPGQWKRDFNDVCQLVPEQLNRENPLVNSCVDLMNEVPPPIGVGRYDYIFVENPTVSHRYNLEVSRIQRRPFPRAQETDNEAFLSDHLGLDLTLYLSPR